MFDTVNIKFFPLRIGAVILCSVLCLYLTAQDSITALSLFDSEDNRPVEVILTTDLKQIQKAKYKEEYQPAAVQIIGTEGDTALYQAEIRSRGNMRKEVCFFPPMRLKFSKKEFLYNKIKWVNICEDNDLNEIFLLKEYLAYQILETLTDYSFRTYLLRVRYQDASTGLHLFTRHAFVIENGEQLAARFEGRVYEPKILKDHLLQREQLALFTFFQYMIGNTDWALANRHNVEVITDKTTNAMLAIPYDFDYSGFVNTGYAAPHETIPVSHVTVRYNKSYCMDEVLCESTRQVFLDKKDEIFKLIEEFDLLDRKALNTVMKYIQDFYKIMDDSKQSARIFVKDCKPWPK